MNLIKENYGITFESLEVMNQIMKEKKDEVIARDGFPEMLGVGQMLCCLKDAGYRLAVASSSPKPVISSTASGISWSPESGLCIQIHGILAALAAFPPFVESSITMHSSTGTPSCFAAKRNVSGAGFGFFTSSPLVTTSKYFIRSSVSSVSVITGFGECRGDQRRNGIFENSIAVVFYDCN